MTIGFGLADEESVEVVDVELSVDRVFVRGTAVEIVERGAEAIDLGGAEGSNLGVEGMSRGVVRLTVLERMGLAVGLDVSEVSAELAIGAGSVIAIDELVVMVEGVADVNLGVGVVAGCAGNIGVRIVGGSEVRDDDDDTEVVVRGAIDEGGGEILGGGESTSSPSSASPSSISSD